MRFDVITLFPEMFDCLNFGILGRAKLKQLLKVETWNPRQFTEDKHQTVDDKPYGGGPGMVMKAAPLKKAIKAAKKASCLSNKVIYLSPTGEPLKQERLTGLSKEANLILICGRYEGIDQRLIEQEIDLEISLGDFVVSGGELPAMLLIDAITRLLPEALGHEDSAKNDSFSNGLLEYPHYTRPELFDGAKVPKVLLSGNHKVIENWRLKQSLGRTWLLRPELLETRKLTALEQDLLSEFIFEYENS